MTACSSAGDSVAASRRKCPMLPTRSRQWSAADAGRSSSRITAPVASRPARAVELDQLVGVAQAAEHPREGGPLGAECASHRRARLAEPGVLLDPRPDRRHDRTARRDDPGDLAEHRHRIRGDHQREPAHGRREFAVVERERLGHVGVEEAGIAPSPRRPARGRRRAAPSLTSMPVTAAPQRPARRPAFRCRSPRRAPTWRRRSRRGSRGSPAAAAGHCSADTPPM